MTLALCMIVKNEEAVLNRCLHSVLGCFDEIVIVDTGSTDKTREIALSVTPDLYDFTWTNDFSAARNFAFSKAKSDFLMWLDADDILTPDNRKGLLRFKAVLTSAIDCVTMRYETGFDEDGKTTFYYDRERIVRRECPHEWVGRVHEVLLCSGTAIHSSVSIRHMSIKKEYSDRNLRIYLSQKAMGEPFSPRDRFYFGRELYYHGRDDEAEKELSACINAPDGWVENKIEACRLIAACRNRRTDTVGAVSALSHTFLYGAPRPAVCCDIGSSLMQSGAYRAAVFWFETALQTREPEISGRFVDTNVTGYLPCMQLCICYDRLGERNKSEEYNRLAGSYKPHDPAYLYNLGYFASLTDGHTEE